MTVTRTCKSFILPSFFLVFFHQMPGHDALKMKCLLAQSARNPVATGNSMGCINLLLLTSIDDCTVHLPQANKILYKKKKKKEKRKGTEKSFSLLKFNKPAMHVRSNDYPSIGSDPCIISCNVISRTNNKTDNRPSNIKKKKNNLKQS